MAEREVVTLGDERLRQSSHAVETMTPEIETLIDDMIETMRASDGVGLAAVQVGEMVRLVLVQTPEDEEEPGSGELYVVLNPEIAKSSSEVEAGIEGCLSIPGYIGEVERSTWVVVRGKDRRGKRFRLRARGFLARAFQHEIDHTNGVLYIDRLTGPDRIWPVEEGEEEKAEAEQEIPASSRVHI
ncbi:MAG: peptide deformylase [Anaerolineae bacterium]